MNYTETYELRIRTEDGEWISRGEYDTEWGAVNAMKKAASYGSGAWRVVRVSEVIIATTTKA